MKEARQARTANLTAILGTLAPLRGTISQNSLKMQASSGNTTLPSNEVIGDITTTVLPKSDGSDTVDTKVTTPPLKDYAADFATKTRLSMLDMNTKKTAAYKSIADLETIANNVINAVNTSMSHINATVNKMRDEKANRTAVEQKALKIADRLNNPTLNVKISRQHNGGWLTKFN